MGKERLYPLPGMSTQKCFNLLNKLGRKGWHANIEAPYEHANGVFKYVGRYIRRGSISERRIIGYNNNTVRITYAHKDKHEAKDFSIPFGDSTIKEGSPAQMANMRPGDIILEINRHEVNTIDDFRKAYKKSIDENTLLLIYRNGRAYYLVLKK